jgi:hypothetical protein
MSLFLPRVNRAAFSCLLSGAHERIKIYDFPHFLCSGGSHLCLLDFGMVFLARISRLQPVFQNPQSQTANLNFMPHAILAKVRDAPAQADVSGIVAKLRKAIRIEIPIGSQDETGFHMGVKPAEKTSRAAAGLVMALNDWLKPEQEL